jgi:hypothetical protein
METPSPAPVVEEPTMATADAAPFETDEGEEDTLSYFDRLAKQS